MPLVRERDFSASFFFLLGRSVGRPSSGRGRRPGARPCWRTRWIRRTADGVVAGDVWPMSNRGPGSGRPVQEVIERKHQALPHKKGAGHHQHPREPPFDRDPHLPGREREGQENEYLGHVAGPWMPRGPRRVAGVRDLSRSPPNPSDRPPRRTRRAIDRFVANFSPRTLRKRCAKRLAAAPVDRYPHGSRMPEWRVLSWFQAALQRKGSPILVPVGCGGRPLADPIRRRSASREWAVCLTGKPRLPPCIAPGACSEDEIQQREPPAMARRMAILGLRRPVPRPCSACCACGPTNRGRPGRAETQERCRSYVMTSRRALQSGQRRS